MTDIADNEIYYPETITDTPFPIHTEEELLTVTQDTSDDTYSSKTTEDTPLPKKRVARELLASALNTRSRRILGEFEFTESGAIQIGKYTNGISGDIKISPSGIVARDSAGITTFALDGTDGSAVFKGTVQAGTLISGEVIVGNNSVIIDGENKQIIVNDGNTDRVLIGYQKDGF